MVAVPRPAEGNPHGMGGRKSHVVLRSEGTELPANGHYKTFGAQGRSQQVEIVDQSGQDGEMGHEIQMPACSDTSQILERDPLELIVPTIGAWPQFSPPLQVVAHNYLWSGARSLELTGNGQPQQTVLAEWGPPLGGNLPDQPFQGFELPVRDANGANAVLRVTPEGVASLEVDEAVRQTTFRGNVELAYGSLPTCPLEVSYAYTPPSILAEWAETPAVAEAGDEGEWVAVPPQTFRQTGGRGGTVSATISDLIGPEDERLLAAYDLRVTLGSDNVEAGQEVPVQIQVFRGEDMLSGDYSGTLTLTHTDANGDTMTFDRPVTVTVP